jgi:hypothetical protein
MAGSGITTAASMIKQLESRGYDQDMAKLALEAVAYGSVEQAAALLNEWSGGPPAPLTLTSTATSPGVDDEPAADDGYEGDGDDDEEDTVSAPRPRAGTPPQISPTSSPQGGSSPTAATAAALTEAAPTSAEDPEDPATPPSTPPRTSPPPTHTSRSSRSKPTIDLPGDGTVPSSVRSAGAAQRQRYAEAALGLSEWDVGAIVRKLQIFKDEIEAGVPVSTISLCLDPSTSLEPEPEPQGGAVVQETDPLEDFRIWLRQVNLIRQEARLLEELDINNPLKDLATHEGAVRLLCCLPIQPR